MNPTKSWLQAAVGAAPAQMAALDAGIAATVDSGSLPPRLRLLVRLLLSRAAGDRHFEPALVDQLKSEHGLDRTQLDSLLAAYDQSEEIDPRECLALRYAEAMFLDARSLDGAFYEELRGLFTDPEIIELASLLAIGHGLYRVSAALSPPGS